MSLCTIGAAGAFSSSFSSISCELSMPFIWNPLFKNGTKNLPLPHKGSKWTFPFLRRTDKIPIPPAVPLCAKFRTFLYINCHNNFFLFLPSYLPPHPTLSLCFHAGQAVENQESFRQIPIAARTPRRRVPGPPWKPSGFSCRQFHGATSPPTEKEQPKGAEQG